MKRWLWGLFMGVGFWTSCQGPIAYHKDSVILAEVGDHRLTRPELRALMPSGLAPEDSAAFSQRLIQDWIDEQMLYVEGTRRLKNLSELEDQVADYRRTLIARSYEQQVLEKQVPRVSDNDCWTFYEQHAAQLTLDRPIVQGLYLKLLNETPQLSELRRNLQHLHDGKREEIEEIETFCLQRAAAYDNFFQQWVDLQTVVSKFPAAPEVRSGKVPSTVRKGELVECSDSVYTYLLFVKDFRTEGARKPYEYAQEEIRNLLLRRQRQEFRAEMLRHLYEEGIKHKTIRRYDAETEK